MRPYSLQPSNCPKAPAERTFTKWKHCTAGASKSPLRSLAAHLQRRANLEACWSVAKELHPPKGQQQPSSHGFGVEGLGAYFPYATQSASTQKVWTHFLHLQRLLLPNVPQLQQLSPFGASHRMPRYARLGQAAEAFECRMELGDLLKNHHCFELPKVNTMVPPLFWGTVPTVLK